MNQPTPQPSAPRRRRKRPRRRLWPFALSLLANLLLALFFVKVLVPLIERARSPLPSPVAIEWRVIEPPPKAPPPASDDSQARQIVSNSRANDQEPDRARYLAERSARVKKQTVGPRGAPPAGTGAPAEAARGMDAQPREPGERGEQEARPRPHPSAPTGPHGIFPSGEQIAKLLAQRQRARRHQGGGGEGQPETEPLPLAPGEAMDLLDPSLEQGPYTLLNQKSFRFASFLNRVFKRVYAHYLRRLYSSSTYTFLDTGDEGEALVETILDRRGEPISTRIVEFKGSPALAETGRYSMEQGAWDLNPPQGIEADDGYIHFVLIARVRFRGLGRTYTPRYQGFIRFGVL